MECFKETNKRWKKRKRTGIEKVKDAIRWKLRRRTKTNKQGEREIERERERERI